MILIYFHYFLSCRFYPYNQSLATKILHYIIKIKLKKHKYISQTKNHSDSFEYYQIIFNLFNFLDEIT